MSSSLYVRGQMQQRGKGSMRSVPSALRQRSGSARCAGGEQKESAVQHIIGRAGTADGQVVYSRHNYGMSL